MDDSQVTNEGAKNGRQRILRFQTPFRSRIFAIRKDITTKSTRIDSALISLLSHRRSLSIGVNVASYQHWSCVSVELSCTRITNKKITVAGGYTRSVDYSESHRYPYSNGTNGEITLSRRFKSASEAQSPTSWPCLWPSRRIPMPPETATEEQQQSALPSHARRHLRSRCNSRSEHNRLYFQLRLTLLPVNLRLLGTRS